MTTLTLSRSQVRTSPLSRRILIAVVCGFMVLHALSFNVIADDAYITFRYAQNFARGNGLVYNAGELVEGYTSPLWTLGLGLLAAAGLSLPRVAVVLSLIFALAMLLATYEFALRLKLKAPLVPLLFLAASNILAYWSTAGMETTLYTWLVLVAALLTLKAKPEVAGLAWAIVYLARPDGALFFGVSAVLVAFSEAQFRDKARTVARFSAPFVVIVAVHLIWRLSYYGYPLPNTFYAKVGGAAWERGLFYVLDFLQYYGIALIALPLALLRSRTTRYIAALTGAYGIYVLYVGGDGLINFRFILPVLPFLYLLSVTGWERVFRILRIRHTGLIYATLVGATLFITLLGAFQTTEHAHGVWGMRQGQYAAAENWQLAGEWLRDHTLPQTLIAVQPAGHIPYYSERPTIDMLGLNDLHIGHMDIELSTRKAGHGKWDAAYIMARCPDIILPSCAVYPPDVRDLPPEALPLAMNLVRVDLDLWYSEAFHQTYELRWATLANGHDLAMFVNRDAQVFMPGTTVSAGTLE